MISHALTIVINELNKHLVDDYKSNETVARLGNLADGFSNSVVMSRKDLYFSVVNLKEEKTLKNLPNYVRNDVTLKALYENPPVFLNLQILVTAPHDTYSLGLSLLSRVRPLCIWRFASSACCS